MDPYRERNPLQHSLSEAGFPIRWTLQRQGQPSDAASLTAVQAELLMFPEVQYWLSQLDRRAELKMYGNFHGSHDYRYENILGKLVQLGMCCGMPALDERLAIYRQRLDERVHTPREGPLSFQTLYSHYDHELIIATFLALAGYQDLAVHQIITRRIQLLSGFTQQKRYDIFVDGSCYPGVKREWQPWLIDPDLYADGNICLPTIHDYFLLSSLDPASLDESDREKIASIIAWALDPGCRSIPRHYGYFWIPGGVYYSKSVCWKLYLPDLSQLVSQPEAQQMLVQQVFLLAHFPTARQHPWFQGALAHLESFQTEPGEYCFPKGYLTERKDGYWIFGAHMGMGEDRHKKSTPRIESTYWMERIHQAQRS